jgi:AcrR family transcriptional regulator
VASVLSAAPRTRPPNRRELILAAATELFAARGYEYVGMSEIAEEVAVQPSALYRHFAGKEQLLAEILRQGVASLLMIANDVARTPHLHDRDGEPGRDGRCGRDEREPRGLVGAGRRGRQRDRGPA